MNNILLGCDEADSGSIVLLKVEQLNDDLFLTLEYTATEIHKFTVFSATV